MAATYRLTMQVLPSPESLFSASNDVAADRFGWRPEAEALGLPAATVEKIGALQADYDALFEDDGEPTLEDEQAFTVRVRALASEVGAALGPDFEVIGE